MIYADFFDILVGNRILDIQIKNINMKRLFILMMCLTVTKY